MTNKTNLKSNKQSMRNAFEPKASSPVYGRFALSARTGKRPDRRAFTLIEMGVGVFLLSICMLMLAQIRTVLISQQLRMDTAETARLQIQNIFESLGDLPDEKIAAQNFDKEKFIKLTANTLPGGEISFEVTPLIFKPLPKNEATPKPAPKSYEKKSDEKKSDQKKITPDVEATVFRITISWSDGINRPRRSLSLARILACPPAKK